MNQPVNNGKKGGFSAPKVLGGVIDNLVHSLGIAKSYHGWMVVTKWPEIVGQQIAKEAEAIRFDDGVLYVAVPDAAWRQNLAMDVEKILNKIQSYPFGRVVTQVRLVQGKKGQL